MTEPSYSVAEEAERVLRDTTAKDADFKTKTTNMMVDFDSKSAQERKSIVARIAYAAQCVAQAQAVQIWREGVGKDITLILMLGSIATPGDELTKIVNEKIVAILKDDHFEVKLRELANDVLDGKAPVPNVPGT